MFILKLFLVVMLSNMNQQTPALFFEYKSQGTYSRQMIEVEVYTDGTVHYRRSKFAPVKVVEEWKGTLTESDYQLFVKQVINDCEFMKLPQRPDEEIKIKDGSFDDFTLIHNMRKYTIGGYGANHYGKYKCVYSAYKKMLLSVETIKYKVKPKS
jgi:hypothetical protein